MEEKARFDPSKFLKPLKGGQYLEVKWRLVWLRTEFPEARIETELVQFASDYAVFKATIELPNGAKATGWGMDRKSDFEDYVERAETRALGRALAALGFGTQFAPEISEGDHIADSPVERARGRSYGSYRS